MILVLEAEGPAGFWLQESFDRTGGKLGRAGDNDMVLSDRLVSAYHAEIVYEAGVYYLIDSSRNGTAVRSPDNRLPRDARYALADGDVIFIEPYRLKVFLREVGDILSDMFRLPTFARPPAPSVNRDPFTDPPTGIIPGSSVPTGYDPLSLDHDIVGISPGVLRSPGRTADRVDDPPDRTPRQYPVWFGTNREPRIGDGRVVDFSANRDNVAHYGWCLVAIPESHRIGSIGSPFWKRLLTLTDDRLKLEELNVLSEVVYWTTVANTLRDIPLDERDAVVFVHGYNVSFEQAALRAAQIGFDLGITGVMAFYSWPSKGTLQGYIADEASIEASEGFIVDFLTKMATESGAGRVNLIAHSMGNRGLLRAIDRIAATAAKGAKVPFNQIILAAADVDRDTFARLSIAYRSVAQRTTMYVCAKDRAVEASYWLHDYPRAGLVPPVVVVPGIDTINVSNLDLTLLGHGYVAEARDVLQDMHRLIREGTPPERRFGLTRAVTEAGETYWMVGA